MKHASAIRVLGFALAVLLAQGWLGTERALATCGDYVVAGGHGTGARQPATLADADTLLPVVNHGPDRAVPTEPCRGPNCSRGSAPLGLPPATIPSHSQDWILPTVALCDFSVEPVGAIQIYCRPHPVLRTGVVFRPPRS
jgi:hypothetical protein